jgi:hypothetical protein
MVAVDIRLHYPERMSLVDDVTAEVIERSNGDRVALRQIVDRLDIELAASPLQRCARLWDVSATQIGEMFGVSRQAAAKWMSDGPPAARSDQIALLDQATDILDRWIKRERVPAVVRRPVESLAGRSRLDVALAGAFEVLRDELADTFDVTRIAP